MKKVNLWVPDNRLDISALGVEFAGLPVASASVELVDCWSGDLKELKEALTEWFTDDASWCRIGEDVHSMTEGSSETRLIPRPGAPGWHAESVHVAGWRTPEGARIPTEYRWQYTRYADRRHETRESCLQEADLREAAAKDGAAGVDKLVRHQQAQLTKWYDALDEFISSVHATEALPGWVAPVVGDELRDWHRTREFLTSAVMKYHHGDVAPRPDTVFNTLGSEFSTARFELAPDH
ncbi:hypothetical protein ACWLMY_35335 [Streptomyces anulatus]